MCFCPFAQGSQGRNECAAPLCQYISVTGALAGQAIGFALQEPFAGQLFQSLGKNRTRNAQIVTHRIEAFDAAKSLSQDQKCPSVSNCADGTCERAFGKRNRSVQLGAGVMSLVGHRNSVSQFAI